MAKGSKQFDVERMFTYHPPFGNQGERYNLLRESARRHAELILDLTPPSREQSLAITDLQRSTQMANAAIACNETQPAVVVEVISIVEAGLVPEAVEAVVA